MAQTLLRGYCARLRRIHYNIEGIKMAITHIVSSITSNDVRNVSVQTAEMAKLVTAIQFNMIAIQN